MVLYNTYKKPWNCFKNLSCNIQSAGFDNVLVFNSLHKSELILIELFGFNVAYSTFINKNLLINKVKVDYNLNLNNIFLGLTNSYSRALIIRGIGFRANIINNLTENIGVDLEFPYSRYILVRAGHSHIVYLPLPDFLGIRTLKKDRKVVVYSVDKVLSSLFIKKIYNLRPPSVYTGRGIRIKKVRVRRKMGKKDVRKGRFF